MPRLPWAAAKSGLIRLEPNNANPRNSLGIALRRQGKFSEAIAEYRAAIQLKPEDAEGHCNLGALLCDHVRDYPAAEGEFRTAIRLNPDLAVAHENLGNALSGQGKHDEAIVEYRTAIRLKPDEANPHYGLGNVLLGEGKLNDAGAAYREAIRLNPDHAEAHCNLGIILQRQGDYAGAMEMFRKGHQLGSRRPDWRYPSAQWVAQAERELALANLSKRFPAMLRGADRPQDNAERLAFAQIAYDRKKFAVATRLWAEALASDPKLGNNPQTQPRYNAACAAALAAAGQGKDEPPLDDAARAKLRRQALDWLKAERTLWSKLLESGPPQARPFIAQTLRHWKEDSDLSGIRDKAALAKLPADESAAFTQLWADVAALLKKAELKPK